MGWSEHEYETIATEADYQEMLTRKFNKGISLVRWRGAIPLMHK